MKLPQIAFLLNSAVEQYAVQSRLDLWLTTPFTLVGYTCEPSRFSLADSDEY